MTFIGTERKTGPRGGSIATFKARRGGGGGVDVKLEEGRPAGGPGVAIGDADGDGLVKGEDVLQPRVLLEYVHERLLGGAGVAEHVADAVGDQLIDEGVAAGHSGHGGGSFDRLR